MIITRLTNFLTGQVQKDSRYERDVAAALCQWKYAVRYFESVNDT